MENLKTTISEKMKTELEFAVFTIADKFWENYNGGVWKFCKEGQYWYPSTNSVKIENTFNYFQGTLYPKAAGIAFSMFACSNLSFKYYEEKPRESDQWAEHYYALRAYTLYHFTDEEVNQIFAFLD